MEEFVYSHDFAGFFPRFLEDDRCRPRAELSCVVYPRTEYVDRPSLVYLSLACGNHVTFPCSERLLSQVRECGMLDVDFAPEAEELEDYLEDSDLECLARQGLDTDDLFERLYCSNALVESKWMQYCMPDEYFDAAQVLRFSHGVVPVNLPSSFVLTRVGYRVGHWSPDECPYCYATFEKDAAPVPLPEYTGIADVCSLW